VAASWGTGSWDSGSDAMTMELKCGGESAGAGEGEWSCDSLMIFWWDKETSEESRRGKD